MLKEWAAELNGRPMTEKRSYQVCLYIPPSHCPDYWEREMEGGRESGNRRMFYCFVCVFVQGKLDSATFKQRLCYNGY